jgi:hypothetical protein
MVDVATADDTPYSFEKEDRIEEERRAAGMGLEWPTGQIRWRTGLLFFLFSPFFFLETPFFLAAFCREKKRRVWKDLQLGYKT